MLRCTKCKSLFIGKWSNQKAQYAKLKELKFTEEKIKEILPLCPMCLKELFKKPV